MQLRQDKLISVLVDTDIKEDILSMSNMNLKETVKVVEGKESGKVAKLKVGVQDTKVSAVKTDSKTVSAVKTDNINTNPDTPTRTKCCGNCNRTGHTSHLAEREASCPAWGKKCDTCGKEGHFKACCNQQCGRRG